MDSYSSTMDAKIDLQKPSPLQVAHDQLGIAMNSLGSTLEELEDRLIPVMDPPEPAGDGENVGRHPAWAVGQVEDAAARVFRQTETVRSLIRRLAI